MEIVMKHDITRFQDSLKCFIKWNDHKIDDDCEDASLKTQYLRQKRSKMTKFLDTWINIDYISQSCEQSIPHRVD